MKAYPAKVLLAWSQAIGGNTKIRDWLAENGYPELSMFTYALWLKDDAMKWLLENGFPHLAAVVSGAEGKEDAIAWLEKYEWDVLANVARVGDGDEKAFLWLTQNGHREMAMVAKNIESVKDEIERDNGDAHKISKA
jgi:hypothetical protein